MRHLLTGDALAVVERLAVERTLCAFDFDGTLAPIVDDPDQAAMRKRTRTLLRSLAERYPCIVVSGRARANVLRKLSGVPVARVIGNHGADTEATQGPHPLLAQWKTALEAAIGSIPGVMIEDKGLSLAVHYRLCAEKAQARRSILAAAHSLRHAHIFGGKQVVNVVADGAPDKGDALAEERDRLRCDWVLYVGDDENDEAAFALDGNLVSVRIGRKRGSHARYFLRTQTEIDELLEKLVLLRSGHPAAQG